MKTITIHYHPEYWGYAATDTSAERWALKMADCARRAGFSHTGTHADGTTEEAECYSADYKPDEECDEIDWFARWCSHGFRGMVAWLKKQKGK